MPVQSLYLCVHTQISQGPLFWMCSCSGSPEHNDIKIFLGEGKMLEDITCIHKYNKGKEKYKAVDLILAYGLFQPVRGVA